MSKQKSDDSRMSRGKKLAVGAAMALPAFAGLMVAGPSPAFGMPGGGCCGGQAPADGKKSGETPGPVAAKATGSLLVDLGNTTCPVMGGTPNGKTFSEWRGLRIGHCCGGCTSKFAAAPEKSLEDAGIEWRDAADAVDTVNDAKGAERVKALAVLKQRWTVVREPATEVAEATGTLVDLGNANCPVRGAAVDGKSFSEWNGVRVGYCCPACSGKFATDPEKYLNDAKIPWREAADAAKAVDRAKGADRAKALEALKKRWKVVREPATEQPTR